MQSDKSDTTIKVIPFKLIVQTDQQAFDHAVKYFIDQKNQCGIKTSEGHFTPLYWSEGNVCVIGSLIDHPENFNYKTLIGHLCLTNIVDPGVVSVDLLIDLQCVHDDCLNWDESGFNIIGIAEMFEIAKTYSLNTKELTNAFKKTRSGIQSSSQLPSKTLSSSSSLTKKILGRLSFGQKRKATRSPGNGSSPERSKVNHP